MTRQTGAGGPPGNVSRILFAAKSKKGVLLSFLAAESRRGSSRGGPDDGRWRPSLIRDLLKREWVHEMLPVGSKGIGYECVELARTAGLNFVMKEDIVLDMKKSAGPATCLLVSLSPVHLSCLLEEKWDIQRTVVGELNDDKDHLDDE